MKKVYFVFLLVLSWAMNPGLLWAQGCMEPTSDDGPQIIGYLQPQFDYHFYGTDDNGESLNASTFRFNRARIGIMGNVPYDFNYYFLMETSSFFQGNPFENGNAFLLDAFITYNRLGPWAKISFGSFKSPISRELNTPCHALYTINRSNFVDQLTNPNRDVGMMISGSTDTLNLFGKKTVNLLKYSFALTNGTGITHEFDDNLFKTFSGRVILTPSKYFSLGGSYLFGKYKPSEPTAEQEDEKLRYGVDVEVRVGQFLAQGEYLFGEDKGSYTTGGGCGGEPVEVHQGSVKRDGFMAMAMYMTPWRLQPVVKFETYDPNTSTDFTLNPQAENDRQNVITYGINYFFNDWTRLQINYLYKAEESADVEVPNDCILVQLQVVF
ncbi:MAG: hypothetical protein Kow00127_04410 [Bacteroidales bacterium]